MGHAVRFEVVPRRAAPAFDRLPEVARDILRLCDGQRTLAAIRASSPIAAAGTERVLERLAVLGLIAARQSARPGRKPLTNAAISWIESGASIPLAMLHAPARAVESLPPTPAPIVAGPESEPIVTAPEPELHFSDEEERFFASSIDHLIEV
jgi:hypothetical protein